MTIEVVGPGFDASNLLRSDSLPHESFETVVPKFSRSFQKRAFEHHTHVMPSEDYQRTVDERLVKIGARLRNPAYPKVIINSVSIQRTRLAKEAMDYLKRRKEVALLNHLEAYQPIPNRFIERFVTGVGNIVEGLSRYNVRLASTSFSGSFTASGRFVFWDFFPANLANAKELYLRS